MRSFRNRNHFDFYQHSATLAVDIVSIHIVIPQQCSQPRVGVSLFILTKKFTQIGGIRCWSMDGINIQNNDIIWHCHCRVLFFHDKQADTKWKKCSFFVTDTFSSLTGGFLKKVFIFFTDTDRGVPMKKCSFFCHRQADTSSCYGFWLVCRHISWATWFPTDLFEKVITFPEQHESQLTFLIKFQHFVIQHGPQLTF